MVSSSGVMKISWVRTQEYMLKHASDILRLSYNRNRKKAWKEFR